MEWQRTQHLRTILIGDLCESVRLYETADAFTAVEWSAIVEEIGGALAKRSGGSLKKSLGDGFLIQFADPEHAVAMAGDIHDLALERSRKRSPANQLRIRIGIATGPVLEDHHDLYGHTVNVAARLMSLARPTETLISSSVHEALGDELDDMIADLGSCYLKNLDDPIQVYRVGASEATARRPLRPNTEHLLPMVALLPLECIVGNDQAHQIGAVLTSELNETLSASPLMGVISHLSMATYRGQKPTPRMLSKSLSADFVLSGRFAANDTQIKLWMEVTDASTGHVVRSSVHEDRIDSLFDVRSDFLKEIVAEVGTAIVRNEIRKARVAALPTLKNYSILVSAIDLMHREQAGAFLEAYRLLDHLVERCGNVSVPHAWLAKWYVLRSQQGWSDDPMKDSFLALEAARRALDSDPESSLALTVDGLVHTHMLKDHESAGERYLQAVRTNPNNALAWLLKGVGHAFVDEGKDAVADTTKAISLSPLDPHRYYYDTLSATAYLTAGRYSDALKAADRSLQSNRKHTSTHRARAIALWQLGREREARNAGADLMKLEPGLTIRGWRARSPATGYAVGMVWADVLRKVGVPD